MTKQEQTQAGKTLMMLNPATSVRLVVVSHKDQTISEIDQNALDAYLTVMSITNVENYDIEIQIEEKEYLGRSN